MFKIRHKRKIYTDILLLDYLKDKAIVKDELYNNLKLKLSRAILEISTRIRDVNGREIYEGDNVRFELIADEKYAILTGKIRYCKNAGAFIITQKNGREYFIFQVKNIEVTDE